MLRVELYGSGVWAWVAQHPSALRQARMRTLARAALRQAFIEWCTRTNYPSLQAIFQVGSWQRMSLTPRGERYQKWQRRVYGKLLPYFSPLKKSQGDHMQFRLKSEGSGFRVSMKNEPNRVVAQLTLPGAKILNAIKTGGAIYRQEFLNWEGAGRFNKQWIVDRATKLYESALRDEITRPSRQRLAA